MRTKKLFRSALVSLTLAAAAVVAPREARAEADVFGIGDGHRGAYAAVALDEVVNAYAPLTADAAASATTLTFGAPIGNVTPPVGVATGFAAGDLVMIWRATGVAAAEAPSGSDDRVNLASNAISGGRVGAFEFARVTAATATTLTLSKALVSAWAKGVTQIVRVPEFTTVSVPNGTSVVATAWQASPGGFVGGIVAFLANGVVTIDGQVHADARGFRGGAEDQVSDPLNGNCGSNDGTEATGHAAKGEGVVHTEFGPNKGGRGNRANGAGGGNCAETGGGGGGGFGNGGAGGTALFGAVEQNNSGRGGRGLDYSLLTRLSMGGGGGAGEQKNGLGSGGGAGGGTVFLRTRSLAGAGFITANGRPADNARLAGVESDGAGGGGAGGSVLIRAVETVTCGGAQTTGGKGGDTTVVGLAVFGAGGGGGGGRILIQAKDSAGCPVSVAPGAGGQTGSAGGVAAGGVDGSSEPLPAPGGSYCFSNADATQCANPNPVCDATTGFCGKCTGPFGGGTPRACNVAVQPVCSTTGATAGTCNACNGDFGTTTTSACQLTTSPYCFLTGATTGSCGKCTTAADCAGPGHGGPACNPTIGACGAPCATDSECKAAEWCAQGVCVAKTPNGVPVPPVPPIDGECTIEKGKRVCLSAVCEPEDDQCGLKNGSPCEGDSGRCRSTICFPADKRCGKPTGEPCGVALECRSNECTAGVCTGCDDDTDCPTNRFCDVATKACVPGCREVAGKSNCATGQRCSKTDGTVGECIPDNGADAGDGGAFNPADLPGIVEGGGCACRTSVPISGSPLALAAGLLGAILLARRRQNRSTKPNDNQDQN